MVLKEERRELYQDVLGLLPTLPPQETVLDGDRIQVWDIPGFSSWPAMEGTPVRVGLASKLPALTIHRLGHARRTSCLSTLARATPG